MAKRILCLIGLVMLIIPILLGICSDSVKYMAFAVVWYILFAVTGVFKRLYNGMCGKKDGTDD